MRSIQKQVVSEIEINKSTFINYLIPVTSIEEIDQQLMDVKTRYSDATHHCYAYLLGEHQEIQKYSDDGEPSKTAGLPMLEVLKKHDVTDVLSITIRYYGGIKLGAGGLVRAYTKSCATSIQEASFTTLQSFQTLEIIIPFDEIGHVEKYIRDHLKLLETTYDEMVHYLIVCNTNDVEPINTQIIDKTSGKGKILALESFKRYV